jgi:GntR family transcriptional regulator
VPNASYLGAFLAELPVNSPTFPQQHAHILMKKKSVPAVKGFKVDPRDSSPLYVQLARRMADAIRGGQYQVDEALPSERLLSDSLEVSRVTARKAIDRLVEQGLVVRRQGSGNYIAPRFEQPLSRLSSFSEELSRRGYTPSSRWIRRLLTLPSEDEQLALGISSTTRVARLERLRLADDVVMAYEVSVLPQTVVPRPLDVENSLYKYLEHIGQIPHRALQHIRAMNAHDKLADQLGVPHAQAVLFITRVGYNAEGRVVELTHSYCRSDYYDFVAEMRRDA